MIFPLALLSLASSSVSPAGDPALVSTAIRIRDAAHGCFHSDVRTYDWSAEAGGFRRGDAFRTRAEVNALRKQLLASKYAQVDALAQIGFTPAALLAHREDVLQAAWPDALPRDPKRILPESVEAALTFESLAPRVLFELTYPVHSTSHAELRFEFPGTPAITVSSDSLHPWKLPWHVVAGGQEWDCADIALTRALAAYADVDGPNAYLLDGLPYWTDEFWRDTRFWSRSTRIGDALLATLTAQQYDQLDGYALLAERFEIDEVMTGSINLQDKSMFFEIHARTPTRLDRARWWNLLKDGRTTSTWHDFLAAYDAAQTAVTTQRWLTEWKTAAPERELGVDVVGLRGFSARDRATFVTPAWKDAGFAGEPEFEIHLVRAGRWCGTAWLSTQESGALILIALGGATEHWFDRLDLYFHPTNGDYGRVDANGTFERRKIAR